MKFRSLAHILLSLQQNTNIFAAVLNKKKSLEAAKVAAAAASYRGKSEEQNYGNNRNCKGKNQI